jgi:hypothetical protein
MNRQIIIYASVLVLILGLIIYIDSTRPKPINWTPTYGTKDKIPLGLYVLDKEAPALFKDAKINKFAVTPYEYFEPLYDYDKENYTAKGTFIHIDERSSIDTESARELLYFAEHGNTVFLSMNDFPHMLLDTLKVETNSSFYFKDSIQFTLADKRAGSAKYMFNEGIGSTYFESIDTLTTAILGHQGKDTVNANFIRVPFGSGSFLLHTQPAAFSNFHLLKGNHHEYAEKVLSHLKDGDIYWYAGQFGSNSRISGSPLRYLFKQPALKWAWYTGLIGLLIFVFFNAKRKQRIIPEIVPLKNTTVDFTKTIGNLYYQEGQHHNIIEKKIIYFLEKIRTEYLIDTYSLDEEFIEKLHLKTGKPAEDIRYTTDLIKKHRHQFNSSEADVIEINKAIEKLML